MPPALTPNSTDGDKSRRRNYRVSKLSSEISAKSSTFQGNPKGFQLCTLPREISWEILVKLQCGQGSTDDELSPICVSSLLGIRIESVAAGLWHTVCISADGDVYAFGGNQFGQLGTGADQAESRQPELNPSKGVKMSPLPKQDEESREEEEEDDDEQGAT